jgi:8-oxo-dGTP pyrophosphatase MutT (NUDIX family)
MNHLPTRLAARVLIIDEQQRVLLLRSVDPKDGAVFWFPPGGGIEPGENAAAAAVREVWEETGLRDVRLDGEVWRRRHVFSWGDTVHDQSERWFLARVNHFDALPQNLSDAEREEITDYRWWTLDELAATGDPLTPRALARLLQELLVDGVPAEPISVGI